ncbi:DUF2793 domain-containing protein [Paracoccus sanguinis]|uniref:DUF2793 domain-containing protein n=1 Tax=Paracoccus sanguinis TaxID=1545044 RepID=UPI0014515F55|nr:DUF2793 domain-containing protein [Paracoccus sanguinis]QJD16312.1 DUF2793 domain-containing protein [Paracoccus sanguinis]
MAEQTTLRCGLPLLQPAQAQKHVTVNEALMRLDGLVNLVLQSVTTAAPPATVTDGLCFAVPFAASGAWAGQDGRIAVGSNGGWVFVAPSRGQQAFVADRGVTAIWTGSAWAVGALTMGAFGAGLSAGLIEADVAVAAGTGFASGVKVPAHSLIVGVTARVTEAITGTLTSWSLGTAADAGQFGSGLGKALNSWAQGLLSAPMAVYAPLELRLTAAGGAFAGGRVRVAVHTLALRLPDPVAA